jgi:hypothetical protein
MAQAVNPGSAVAAHGPLPTIHPRVVGNRVSGVSGLRLVRCRQGVGRVVGGGPAGEELQGVVVGRMNGRQGGDPAKLATALIQLASSDEPPPRWAAGADAVGVLEQKANTLVTQADAYRALSSSLSHDDAG